MSSERGSCVVVTFLVLGAIVACATQARAEAGTDLAPVPKPSHAPERRETREARELTARARERFDAGDYPAALVEFSRAHELLADDPRRAALLNNIAVCHERMFRYDLALTYYQRYLQEGAASVEDRREVEAVIRGLRDLLGKLHLTSNVRAEVWVDGVLLGRAPGDIQVPAGVRVIELRASGFQAGRRTLQIAPRALLSTHFELEPLPSYHGIDRRYFWSGVGLTAVALVTGAGLGLRALGKYHEAKDLRRDDLLAFDDPRQRSMQRLALAADVAFGAAALFGVGTVVLAFLTDFRAPERKADTRVRAGLRHVDVQPAWSATSLRLRLSGAW